MRKTFFLLLIICILFPLLAEAQAKRKRRSGGFKRKKQPYKYELVGALGAANILGDLGGADQIGTNGMKDLEWILTRPAAAASIRFPVAQYFTFKNNLYFGIVRGDDKLTKEPFRNTRNLHFKSPVIELSSQIEFNFMREQKGHIYRIKGVRGMRHKDRQIYLFAGGGAFYFNPQAQYINGKWYALRQFKTEGVAYSRVSPLIALGGGARFALDRYWGFGFELGMRKTFTDYIDDVSTVYPDPAIFNGDPIAEHFSNNQLETSPLYCKPCIGELRGDKKDKDAYMFAVFTVNYKVMYRKRSRSKF